MKLNAYIQRLWASFTFVGLVFATLFFAASLTPSLLPRIYIIQGILSGFALATGYGVGILIVWLWHYLQLPEPAEKVQNVGKRCTAAGVIVVAIVFLWRATVWQNSIRELMEMPPIESADPWRIAAIAVILGVGIVVAARTIWWCCIQMAEKLKAVLPQRISYILSTLAVGAALVMVANNVFAEFAIRVADNAFLRLDELTDDDTAQPKDWRASGSKDSAILWNTIGRQGKKFISGGPTQQQISEFSGNQAMRPLRIYVGVRTEDTPEQRAKLALEELIRVKAFERSKLIVATPTGTGWLDPSAVDTLEYLHGGDTAIVATQYSYLPSWLTIFIDSNRSKDSAQALFDEVYEYWKTLSPSKRPELYLHGLSLGSLGSESCADLFTLFADPIQGAVWSGPPFPSTRWNELTRDRNSDSSAWLPTFRDGKMVRFTAQENAINKFGRNWGPMRFVYVQYASDPMIFFSPDLVFHEPAWLTDGRGPDVSAHLQWYPIVTSLQIAFDLPMATSVPLGYGHNYSPSSYIDAWIAVTQPENWSDVDTKRLKQQFKDAEGDISGP